MPNIHPSAIEFRYQFANRCFYTKQHCLRKSVYISGHNRLESLSWQYASLGRVWRCWCANGDSGFYLSLGRHDSSSVLLLYLQIFTIYNPFHFNISTETVFNLMPSYLRPRCTMIGAGRLMRGSKSEKHGNHGWTHCAQWTPLHSLSKNNHLSRKANTTELRPK